MMQLAPSIGGKTTHHCFVQLTLLKGDWWRKFVAQWHSVHQHQHCAVGSCLDRCHSLPRITAAGIVRTFSRGWIEHRWKSDLKSDSASRSFLLKTKAGKTLPAETSKYSASCSAPLAHDLQHLRSCPCDDKLQFAHISLLQMEHPRPQNNWRGPGKFGEEMEDSKIAEVATMAHGPGTFSWQLPPSLSPGRGRTERPHANSAWKADFNGPREVPKTDQKCRCCTTHPHGLFLT
jgi:hypothetical protein